jgi:hypothetical protein
MGKKIDITEFARQGGNAFKQKYGPTRYSAMGKKSAAKKSPEFYRKFSSLGILARKKKREDKEKDKRNPMMQVAVLLEGD